MNGWVSKCAGLIGSEEVSKDSMQETLWSHPVSTIGVFRGEHKWRDAGTSKLLFTSSVLSLVVLFHVQGHSSTNQLVPCTLQQ